MKKLKKDSDNDFRNSYEYFVPRIEYYDFFVKYY